MIKKFRTRGEDFLLPDRNSVTMTVPFMRAYTELLVRTCHKRGAHAIGGMAAFIPSKDEEINKGAFDKVRDDKTREAGDGFDGSWVAHPAMVALCTEVFDSVLGDRPNQVDSTREEVHVTADQLLDVRSTPGAVTEAGLRSNISVGMQYLEAWLRGSGAVGINNMMEDAATAEISRSQVWQWLHNDVKPRRRPDRHPRPRRAADRGGDGHHPRAGRRRRLRPGPLGRRPRRCSPRWRSPTTSRTSSPSRPTSGCREGSRREHGRTIARLAARLRGRARATPP